MAERLILEDGTAFEGKFFGTGDETAGLVVFYTGVVGYQEVVTDPANQGRIVVFAYPHIGNYGVNEEDFSSPRVQAAGIVIKELSPIYSNFRATGSFEDFMKKNKLSGLREVDTRAIVVRLRDRGEIKGMITSSSDSIDKIVARLKKTEVFPAPDGKVISGAALVAGADLVKSVEKKAGAKHLAIIDLGANKGFYEMLAKSGYSWDVFGPKAKAGEVLGKKPAAVVVTEGPFAPEQLKEATNTVKELLGKVPVWGISLGCVVLGTAAGAKHVRMSCGHHGVNYSAKPAAGGRGEVTVQNHSFNLDEDSLSAAGLEVSWRNVNDGSIEGISSKKSAAAGTLFYPLNLDELEGLVRKGK